MIPRDSSRVNCLSSVVVPLVLATRSIVCACVFACVRVPVREKERDTIPRVVHSFCDRKCLTEVIHGEFR